MMTNAELLRIVRRPGKVYMPVAVPDSVTYLPVEKNYIIGYLVGLDGRRVSAWRIERHIDDGIILTVQR